MAVVTGVTVHSSLGKATIDIERPYTGQRGHPLDLPPDMRDALWKWLAPTRDGYCDLCGSAPCSSIVACASARD